MSSKVPKPYCKGCHDEPSVHLSHVAYGKTIRLDLCENCPFLKEFNGVKAMDFKDMLTGLLGNMNKPSQPGGHRLNIQCAKCRMSLEEFLKKGRLGCPECYRVFQDALTVLIKNIHGTGIYKGKVPASMSLQSDGI